MIAGIHFQYITDEGQMMEKILSANRPFLASISPVLLDKTLKDSKGRDILERVYPEKNYYPEWFIDVLRENKDNPNVVFGQEGYTHYCERCFEKYSKNGGREKDAFPDPFHEHVCLDGNHQDYVEQMDSIVRGKDLIKTITGITPEIYCPPNHLFNENTLELAKMYGFEYFMIRNFVGLPAYLDEEIFSMMILPESPLRKGNNSPVIYTYYDHLVDGKWKDFRKVLDVSDKFLIPSERPELKIELNSYLLTLCKKARDWKKKLRMQHFS